MKIRSKKGSYIMEAAIVLPMIMLATITAVLIIMFFYSQMTDRSNLHVILRDEAGMMSERTTYLSEGNHGDALDAEIYRDASTFGGMVYGKKYLIMSHKGVLNRKGTFTVEGSAHATDGVKYVRYCNLVKEIGDGENQ